MLEKPIHSDARIAVAHTDLASAAPPPLQALDVATFVNVVNHYGPTTEVRAYPDAFALVALVEGQEVIRIVLRPSEAIKIVRNRSGEPLTPHRLAGALRAVESWEVPVPGRPIARLNDEGGVDQFVGFWEDLLVVRVVPTYGGRSFEAKVIEIDDEDETVNHSVLSGRETAFVNFFDRRQYSTPHPLDFRFAYEARNGKLRTTYRLPRFREQRDASFAEVIDHVAGETGTKPLMLVSDAYEKAEALPRHVRSYNFAAMKDGEAVVVFEDGPIYMRGSQPTANGWSSYALRVVVMRCESEFVVEIQESQDDNPWIWKATDLGDSTGDCDRTYRQSAFEEGVQAVATYYRKVAKQECDQLRKDNAQEAAEYGITEKALRDQWDTTATRLNEEEDLARRAA